MKDKIIKIIYGLFFAAVIAIVLLLVATKLPLPGNFHVYIVQSGSMEPAIKTGAIVAVKPQSDYQIGDVITFSSGGRNAVPITHRIMEIKEAGARITYITKGDANDTIDLSEVASSRVLGRVLFSIPYVGYGVAAAKKPFGFLLIIVVPALLIIYDEAVKVIKEIKKYRENKKIIKEDEKASNEQ